MWTLPPQGRIGRLAFRPGGNLFAATGDPGTARIRESATGRPIGEPLDRHDRVDCLAFRADGSMVATGGPDGFVRLWCAGTGLSIGPPLEQDGAVRTLAFSPDGRRLASSGSGPTVRCWEVPNPVEGNPDRVACWVSHATGLEFDEGDAIRPMDGPTSWDLRRRLDDLGGPPPSVGRASAGHSPRRRP